MYRLTIMEKREDDDENGGTKIRIFARKKKRGVIRRELVIYVRGILVTQMLEHVG